MADQLARRSGVMPRELGAGTTGRPSLAVRNGRLFMAWKGTHADHGIYWVASDLR
jgi:hypothetical protein